MSTAFLQSIPEVTMSPTSGGSSRPTTELSGTPGKNGGFGRRTFLRTAMAGAATLAFTGLGWIAEGSGPRRDAQVPPPPPLHERERRR